MNNMHVNRPNKSNDDKEACTRWEYKQIFIICKYWSHCQYSWWQCLCANIPGDINLMDVIFIFTSFFQHFFSFIHWNIVPFLNTKMIRWIPKCICLRFGNFISISFMVHFIHVTNIFHASASSSKHINKFNIRATPYALYEFHFFQQ